MFLNVLSVLFLFVFLLILFCVDYPPPHAQPTGFDRLSVTIVDGKKPATQHQQRTTTTIASPCSAARTVGIEICIEP